MKSDGSPLVSVLTPAWNRSAYLGKVWAGLESQIYKNIEWIIANDGSTDDTKNVCNELQRKSRFPVTIIESNLRVGKPRMDNELIKAAKGDFIIWCDSDDYLLPGAIERLINVWESIPAADQASYIGLTALCATEAGILQSALPSRSGVFETTWNDLNEIYQVNTDMLIFFRSEKIRNSRFIEVDFMVSEGSLWLNFFDMKTKFIPEVLKIMDRGAVNRISLSGKMEYCRGKAYSIAMCEKIKPTPPSFNRKFIWKLVTYHRYCIHGDLGFFIARNLWNANLSVICWLILYPLGLMLAVKDLFQRKVVKTHIEFDRHARVACIRRIDPN